MTVPHLRRIERLAARLGDDDAIVVGPSADFRYLTGVRPFVSERLVALVVSAEGTATVLAPALEQAAFEDLPDGVRAVFWGDGEEPSAVLTRVVGAARRVRVDRTWEAGHLLALRAQEPGRAFGVDDALAGLRAVKDDAEVAALAHTAAVADAVLDAVATSLGPRETEAVVSRRVDEGFRAHGADEMFALVASAARSAHPHHRSGAGALDGAVLFDVGVRLDGYWSDTSRTFAHGEPAPALVRMHAAVLSAQQEAVRAIRPGVPAAHIDRVARDVLTEAGFGDAIKHRTGHGIGLSMHEAPFLVAGDETPLEAGHVVTVEPGVYVDGVGGVRIEDVVVVTVDGARPLNALPRALRRVGV